MPALAKNRSIGPKCLLGLLDQGDVAGLRRHVGDDADGPGVQLVGDGGDAVEVGHDDPGAGSVEAAGQRGADAAGRPGDDDMAILEVHRGDRTRLGDGHRSDGAASL